MIREKIELMKLATITPHSNQDYRKIADNASIAMLELLEDFLLSVKNIDENLGILSIEIQNAIRNR